MCSKEFKYSNINLSYSDIMCGTKIKNAIINAYIIFIIVTGGFIGTFTFNGIIKECGVEAQNIIVDCNGNGNYTTIQEAITNANPGQIIRVWDGIYNETLVIDKTVTLIGNGTQNTTINGTGIGDVVYITANWVNITGFTIQNSGDDITKDAGIKVIEYDFVSIINNNLTNNTHGICLFNSDFNIIKNNNISYNRGIGIDLTGSDSNVIINNNNSYNYAGISTYVSYFNSILNNTCNFNNWDGINILGWNDKILNNTCNFNKRNGIILLDSANSLISNNTCNSNNNDGIFIPKSLNPNTITNNTCNFNWDNGIEIRESHLIDIRNNTFNSNLDAGLELYNTYKISIGYNNITLNKKGIYLFKSDNTNVYNNNFTDNEYGFYLKSNSNSNKFNENIISNNRITGIFILSDCNSNLFYHNQIISNTKQAQDNSNNNWSYQGEGNYWSDYTGLDNGFNERWKGDGIGDTKIPHPGSKYDNYPFIKPYGWRFPAIPVLFIESDIDPDGNYTISWSNRSRANGFIFEEDTDIYFSSPVVYTDGWVLENKLNVFYLSNKVEDTYYYRIQANNNFQITDWSEIVNVTVDHLPTIPENLQISPVPDGNALYITWNPNLKDTLQYRIYYLIESTWEFLKNVTHPTTSYIHTELKDGTIYSYKICAVDSNGQSSGFTENVSGIPRDIIPPTAPGGLKAVPISDSKIEFVWYANTELDLSGYLIYINESGNNLPETFRLNKTIHGKETSCIITGLDEQITYFFKIKAFDEVPNNSTFSESAQATTLDLTHPQIPTGLEVFNATSNSLTLSWVSNTDPDVIGYYIYRSRSFSTGYLNITDIIKETRFIDFSLEEDTYYYYKITAVDDANLSSLLSDPAIGKTLIGPRAPIVNKSITIIEIIEDTIDNYTINLKEWFIDPNNDILTFYCTGQNNLNITIEENSGKVIIQPKLNWNGEENLTFYANDSRFETFINISIIVTEANDPPIDITIIQPSNGAEFKENELIDFIGFCDDPDLLYGDKLKFSWSSNLDGILGDGEIMKNITLSKGEHIIKLEVSDNFGERINTTIKVTIVKIKDEQKPGDNLNNIIISINLIIILIIIAIIVFILIKKKKLKFLIKEKKDDNKS